MNEEAKRQLKKSGVTNKPKRSDDASDFTALANVIVNGTKHISPEVYTTEFSECELREIASLLSDAVKLNNITGDDTRFVRAVTLANWFDGMANALVERRNT